MVIIQKWHRVGLIFILFITILTSLNFASALNVFVYDLSITTFTSILMYLLIDNVLERYNRKEENKKLNIIIEKIEPSINKFYNLFVSLYAGTIEKPIEENSPMLKNIFYDKDELYKSIVENLIYTEESPYGDADKFIIMGSLDKIDKSSLIWQKVWINHYTSLYSDLIHLQMYYGIFLSSELLYKLEALIKPIRDYLLINKNMENIGLNKIQLHMTNEVFYQLIKLREIMTSFEDFIGSLQARSAVDFMSVDIDNINNRDEKPLLGDLLK